MLILGYYGYQSNACIYFQLVERLLKTFLGHFGETKHCFNANIKTILL